MAYQYTQLCIFESSKLTEFYTDTAPLCSGVFISLTQTISFFMPLVISLQATAKTVLFLQSVDRCHHLLSCH